MKKNKKTTRFMVFFVTLTLLFSCGWQRSHSDGGFWAGFLAGCFTALLFTGGDDDVVIYAKTPHNHNRVAPRRPSSPSPKPVLAGVRYRHR